MATFNIELKSTSLSDSNEHSLMLRITENKQHARITLPYQIAKKDFNPKAKNGNHVRSSHSNHKKINSYLLGKLSSARDAYADLDKAGKFITAKTIKNKLTNKEHASFYDYIKSHIAHLEKVNQVGSYKKYTSTHNLLKDYTKKDNLLFKEIDSRFLKDFESHLLSTERKQTTIRGYMVKIRAIFNMAIADGLIEYTDNPFVSFKIKQGIVIKDRLTFEEVQLIADLKLSESNILHHVRNLFVFSFYTCGMRISDSLFLKWENIDNDELAYIMHKTGKVFSIKLVDPAVKIIDSYRKSRADEEYIFPILDTRYNLDNPRLWHDQLSAKTALVNKHLKTLAADADITKRITSHTARHSFADLARTKTDNLYNISKMLGHGDIKTTEAYLANFDKQSIDDAMDKVFG